MKAIHEEAQEEETWLFCENRNSLDIAEGVHMMRRDLRAA